jgi:hypothetical protein
MRVQMLSEFMIKLSLMSRDGKTFAGWPKNKEIETVHEILSA